MDPATYVQHTVYNNTQKHENKFPTLISIIARSPAHTHRVPRERAHRQLHQTLTESLRWSSRICDISKMLSFAIFEKLRIEGNILSPHG